MADITIAGERGVLITMTDTPTPTISAGIVGLADFLRLNFPEGITDVIPSYTTLGVFFDPEHLTRNTLIAIIGKQLEQQTAAAAVTGKQVALPVYYHPDVAPDLQPVATAMGFSIAEVIARHSGSTYHAYANGFAPGFCYLGHLDPELALARRATPRRQVPAGSVAIADRQTAVYPCVSPGGWHLIGRCPSLLFNADNNPPNLLNVGDSVTFRAIERREFLDLGGVI